MDFMLSTSSPEFIPVAAPDIGELERRLVREAVDSGWVSSLGPFVDRFEQSFSSWLGVRHAVTVASGTAALELALEALGIGAGDEVIVPDLTFAAVAAAVTRVGASPVLVEVDDVSWCMDPGAVEAAISHRTGAIIAVHSFGHPAELYQLQVIARKANIALVEDCAEAHGARIRGRIVGSLGDVACFSFYGNKIVTTGEGGMVATNSGELAQRVRLLRDHGMDPRRRYFHVVVGHNYRMTNIQAALGCAQMARIDAFLAGRKQILDEYRRGLPMLRLNPSTDGVDAVNWLTRAELPEGMDRDAVMRHLRSRGIDSRPVFFPLSQLPPYQEYRRVGLSEPGASAAGRLARQGICLPTSTAFPPGVVARVAEALCEALAHTASRPT